MKRMLNAISCTAVLAVLHLPSMASAYKVPSHAIIPRNFNQRQDILLHISVLEPT